MNKKVKITVVIPAYNVDQYIGRTLDSTINQTFEDYEVVVVDDGSKDDTGAICDKYAAENEKIIAIHQENEGVMAARLNGVAHSHGEWIMFLDGDDRLPPGSLYKLFVHASDGVDVVLGTIEQINSEGEAFSKGMIAKKGLLSNTEFAQSISRYPRGLHGAIYRRTILYNISVSRKIVNNEDQIFNIFLTGRIKNVYVTNEVVHYYTIRTNSVSKHKYGADYWYMMIAYVRDNYQKYNVKDIIYRRYILTRICSISRSMISLHLDFKNPVFDHLRCLKYSCQYGIYGIISICIIKHPDGLVRKLIQMHPRYFVKKLRKNDFLKTVHGWAE